MFVWTSGRQPESDELIKEHHEVDRMQALLAAAEDCIMRNDCRLAVAYLAEIMNKR